MPDEQTISERIAAAWAPQGPGTEQAKELILRDLRALESDYADTDDVDAKPMA